MIGAGPDEWLVLSPAGTAPRAVAELGGPGRIEGGGAPTEATGAASEGRDAARQKLATPVRPP